jgi:iron(III) transport system substrate-binding protein
MRFTLWMMTGVCVLGCARPQSKEVVVYSALDEDFAQPILDDFEGATGITPLAKFDAESTKEAILPVATFSGTTRF